MVYLIDLASKFQRLVSLALSATHGANDAFDTDPAMRLALALVSRMQLFSNKIRWYGETYAFESQDDFTSGVSAHVSFDECKAEQTEELLAVRKEENVEEIIDLLYSQALLPCPRHGEIKAWLLRLFCADQGSKLGTFNASILATAMKR